MNHKRWLWGSLLILLLGIGLWLILPPLERTFAPQVTVEGLRASPGRYINRVVEVRGDLRFFGVTVCGTPGSAGYLLTDTPHLWPLDRFVPITWEQPFPMTAIELRRNGGSLAFSNNIVESDIPDDHKQDIKVWGRLRQKTIENCPWDSAKPGRIYLYLDIERIQLADGRVLP